MSETRFNPDLERELAGVESLLRSLRPAAGGLDRDSLMFHAGRLSARGSPWAGGVWFWPSAAAAMTVLAVTLGAALMLRFNEPPVERIVYLPIQPPARSTPQNDHQPVQTTGRPTSDVEPTAFPRRVAAHSSAAKESGAADADRWQTRTSYLEVRSRVLAHGIDALSGLSPAPTGAAPEPTGDLVPATRRDWLRLLDLNGLPATGERS